MIIKRKSSVRFKGGYVQALFLGLSLSCTLGYERRSKGFSISSSCVELKAINKMCYRYSMAIVSRREMDRFLKKIPVNRENINKFPYSQLPGHNQLKSEFATAFIVIFRGAAHIRTTTASTQRYNRKYLGQGLSIQQSHLVLQQFFKGLSNFYTVYKILEKNQIRNGIFQLETNERKHNKVLNQS